jgi:hypothetical protein
VWVRRKKFDKEVRGNLYAPTNTPAIGDLFDLFDFGGDHSR